MPETHDQLPALRIALPPDLYATAGIETKIYFSSLIASPSTEGLAFNCECGLGVSNGEHWSVTPQVAEAGAYTLLISVRENSTGRRAFTESTLHVSAPASGRDEPFKLLLVGDSLTHASVYAAEVRDLLATANIEARFLGTHTPEQAAPGIAHEGYGGWTWERFLYHYEPDAEQPPHRATSPFVFAGENGAPGLDVPRYLAELKDRPDIVTFLLGINDAYLADWRDSEAIDRRIDEIFVHAETVLSAFRSALPEAQVGILLTPAPNGRDTAFVPDEHHDVPRKAWLKLRHRLVERQIAQFGGRESEKISLVPTFGIDPIAGYPEDNAVHPNEGGYRQLAIDVYAWLNRQMSNCTNGER